MAKKQIIILSHGSGTPTAGKFNGLGEVLVQHGTGATETMLHTLDVNSGVTSFPSTAWVENKVTAINGAAEALAQKVTNLEISATTLDSKIDTKYGEATGYTDNQINALKNGEIKANTEAIAAAESTLTAQIQAVDAKVETKVAQSEYDAKVAELAGAISTESETRASAVTELTTAVNGKVAQSEYDAKVANFEGRIAANTTKLGELETAVANNLTSATTYTDNQIAALKGTFDGTIGALEDVVDGLVESKADASALTETSNALAALDDRVEVNEGKIATLIGADADKSVRTIANEELAAQLIAEGAAEKLDTLKEIADWIQQHPEDAAAMNTAIEANATAITALDTAYKAADAGLLQKIEAIEKDYLKASDKSELKNLITAETANREEAVKAVNDKLGTGFTSENTVAKAIADEITARANAVAGVQGQIDTISGNYIKEIEVLTGNNVDDKIVATVSGNKATIDLKVIDGGEY